MFERFSPEARAVLTLAQEEARTLRHDYLGTEHLLLGVLRTGGLASRVLNRQGIALGEVRTDVVAIIGRGPAPSMSADDTAALRAIGIDLDEVRRRVEETFGPGALDRPRRAMSRRGRRCVPPVGSLPLTPRAKKVLELALRESLRLRHDRIGSEHVLLGLVREGEGVAVQVLVARGASAERIRAYVDEELRGGNAAGRSA